MRLNPNFTKRHIFAKEKKKIIVYHIGENIKFTNGT